MNFKILLTYTIIINVVTFIFFGVDKKRAKKSLRRISEFNLLSLSFAGGALGGIIGMKIFHHKTKKPIFKFLMPIFLLLNMFLFFYIYPLTI